ncbi:PTS system mannose/fructose/sorbose family transporter subunit IID [Serratia nevei]|uniref:PTS system mannose/fructose/sorbose family transporter subunit IID n=1 Tax=Serratia nevei TaxID=2703794 RepID=UPI003F7DADB9
MDEADVTQKARAFVAKVDVSGIREDLTPYVVAANAKVKKEELSEGESGYTITKPNGKHVITVNSLETEERQRFTICHEIAHIVLALESSHEEVPSWSYAKRHPNEIACDTFAAELLMPYQQWLSLVPKEEPSLELIQGMAALFSTSFPAAASRFASLSDIPCAFVTIRAVKVALMGPLGGIGDALFWLTLLPICAGIGASLALEGSLFGPIVFLLLFNLFHFGLRFGLAHYGYQAGTSALALLKTHTRRISHAASIVGMTVIGALVASYVHLSTPLVMHAGKASVALQTDVLDKLMPNLLPLCFTLLIFFLMKRGFSPVKLIGVTVAIGVAGKFIGIL